ncbi:ribose-5-phosphate isomerase [Glycomyces salinus]|uniref:ribose-5-phosphate isomerase n=1 Tax=Glycomyces salinus TaxID=980294 RepID=UPI0018EA4633|nr:ribose-5-phosphate isomerase [Glycomyces salinus]
MRIYLGSDHAGFELKEHLVKHLAERGFDVVDVGPAAFDPEDDYPPFCLNAAAKVVADPGSLGVVIGGSGNGEQIAANKVPGCRAALAWSVETARLGRQHNDANVVAVGGRMHSLEESTSFVDAFVDESFSGAERHQRRIDQLSEYEREHRLPEIP